MRQCDVCFRHCQLNEGDTGFCAARGFIPGQGIVPLNYGRVTALALDPVEKKPLARFHPGSMILSYGSFGCNLRCPFCQNSDISWSDETFSLSRQAFGESPDSARSEYISPEELAATAEYYRDQGNIGVAFTYNEPLVGYEYVRDAARLVHENGMLNVLVTNGCAELTVLEEILPYIDAMNIDLKGFSDYYYSHVLRGNRKMIMDFIEHAAGNCHVELTTLIVPGENDSEDEMRAMTEWIASLPGGCLIPLHVTRFFPRFHMTDRQATDVRLLYRLANVARERLEHVYTGNC